MDDYFTNWRITYGVREDTVRSPTVCRRLPTIPSNRLADNPGESSISSERLEKDWQMMFHPEKCVVDLLSKYLGSEKPPTPNTSYTPTNNNKYLGVTLGAMIFLGDNTFCQQIWWNFFFCLWHRHGDVEAGSLQWNMSESNNCKMRTWGKKIHLYLFWL